ncbi:hypothetical protein C0993_002470, partial [Termitomyces sp. T159_Od127]
LGIDRHFNILCIATKPAASASTDITPGTALDTPPLLLSGLVLPTFLPYPPFEVANTAWSTVTVLIVRVSTVVANVVVAAAPGSFNPSSVRKTSAYEGAGTGIVQMLVVASQLIVVMLKSPMGLPSEPKSSPNVCGSEC